jgi:CheY-like chemotaxis protein
MELRKATLLLVEDEPFLREIMSAWLERAVGGLVSAENGREALEILRANKIDLIISDVRMPVMNGIEMLKQLNQSPAPRPGLIFVSGFSDLTLRDAYAMGAEAILEKPIKREELLEIAQTSLVGLDELWQRHPGATRDKQLKIGFPSLEAALRRKRIAFGRRGFCITLPCAPREGPLQFAIKFRDEGIVLSGLGVVRWVASEEDVAGVEITSLDQPGRDWLIAYIQRSQPQAFIPNSTRVGHRLERKAA